MRNTLSCLFVLCCAANSVQADNSIERVVRVPIGQEFHGHLKTGMTVPATLNHNNPLPLILTSENYKCTIVLAAGEADAASKRVYARSGNIDCQEAGKGSIKGFVTGEDDLIGIPFSCDEKGLACTVRPGTAAKVIVIEATELAAR